MPRLFPIRDFWSVVGNKHWRENAPVVLGGALGVLSGIFVGGASRLVLIGECDLAHKQSIISAFLALFFPAWGADDLIPAAVLGSMVFLLHKARDLVAVQAVILSAMAFNLFMCVIYFLAFLRCGDISGDIIAFGLSCIFSVLIFALASIAYLILRARRNDREKFGKSKAPLVE